MWTTSPRPTRPGAQRSSHGPGHPARAPRRSAAHGGDVRPGLSRCAATESFLFASRTPRHLRVPGVDGWPRPGVLSRPLSLDTPVSPRAESPQPEALSGPPGRGCKATRRAKAHASCCQRSRAVPRGEPSGAARASAFGLQPFPGRPEPREAPGAPPGHRQSSRVFLEPTSQQKPMRDVPDTPTSLGPSSAGRC